LGLLLAHVIPGGLDVGYSPLVDSVDILLDQGSEHFATKSFVIHGLGLDFIEHLFPQIHDLVRELVPELGHLHAVQVLQLALIGDWPHHGETVSLTEKGGQMFSNSVLLFDVLGGPFLQAECLLQVFLGCYGPAFGIHELEGEVPDHPVKSWEKARHLFGILFRLPPALDMYVFRKVDNETQLLQRIFIDGPRTIIDERRGQEYSQRENPGVMGLILLQ
jgi:hypothetical protein